MIIIIIIIIIITITIDEIQIHRQIRASVNRSWKFKSKHYPMSFFNTVYSRLK